MKILPFILLAASAVAQTSRPANVQATDPNQTNSFAGPVSLSNTFTANNPGVFTGTQMNEYAQSLVNNCNPGSLWHSVFTLFATEGLVGCVTLSSGSTVVQATGVTGYVENQSTSSNAVGLQGFARNDVANAPIWGMDTMTTDQTGIPANSMYGYEDDVNVRNTTSIPIGMLITGFWTQQPTNGYALQIAPPQNTGHWPMGLMFLPGATTTTASTGAALFFHPIAGSANQPSQGAFFLANQPVSGQTGAAINLLATGFLSVTFPGNLAGALQVPKIMVAGTAPTCTFTSGGGTSPSCTVDTGSTDTAGIIIATTGSGSPAGTGTITLTFSAALGTNKPVCLYEANDGGAGAWAGIPVFKDHTPATTSDLFTWTNQPQATGANTIAVPTALSTSTAYWINYQCWGK